MMTPVRVAYLGGRWPIQRWKGVGSVPFGRKMEGPVTHPRARQVVNG